MTDLSNMTMADLDQTLKCNNRTIARYGEENKAIVAEIERRKAEPDWAAWEPKWQAFREAMEWSESRMQVQRIIRALIAAHNTPLAGEWTEYAPENNGVRPEGVSLKTHEIERMDEGVWCRLTQQPTWWLGFSYRYRPRQS